MDFLLSDIHSDLASTVDAILTKADMPAIIRAYAADDPAAVTPVREQLAEAGICGLIVDDEHGGSGAG
ncbi:MAG: acyl-CoA dehydrogenase, partial [Gordonia amarae]